MTVPVNPLSKLFNRVFRDHPAHLDHELCYLIDMVGSSYQDNWMAKIKTDEDMWNAIKHYLERGADINACADRNQSALSKLCEKNQYPGVVAKMIAEGADVNVADSYLGFTALIYAAMKCNPEIMKALLDGGADVNASTTGGNNWNVMSFLIYNAEYNCRNNPQTGRDCLRMLLDHGATLSDEDKKYILSQAKSLAPVVPEVKEALEVNTAAENGDAAAVRDLLAKGAAPDAAAGFGVDTALQRAIALKKDPAILEALLSAGADHERRSPTTGFTPLQEAAHAGNREAFGRLIGAGADAAAPLADGKQANLADIAAASGDAGMAGFVKQTIEAHANGGYDATLDHKVAIHHALHLKPKLKPAMAV